MELEVITGVTEKRSIKVFSPTLAIGISGAGGSGIDCFSSVRAEVRLVDGLKGSDETLIPDVKLQSLAEFASRHNGQYYLKSDKSVFDCLVDLTEVGGIDLNGQKYLVINLYGLVATATYTIDAIDDDSLASFYYRWSKMNINAGSGNQIQKFNNEGSEFVMLPTANLIEVNFVSKSGGSKRWNQRDLKKYSISVNPIVRYNESGAIVSGYDIAYIVPIDDIRSFEVTTNGTVYEFYTIDTKLD